VRFGFVESPADICVPQFTPGQTFDNVPNNLVPPNDRLGDGIINHLAHELLEAANDPDHDAWFIDFATPRPDESADQCSFHFVPFLTRPDNNGNYDLRLNGHYYLVQQELVNLNSGYCAMISFPASPALLYPNDALLHVPADFQRRWKDGLDGTPPDSNHPVTYSLNYKYWSYGSTEPGSYMKAPITCNSDGAGTCSQSVSGAADGFYRWYVEASMDTSLPPHTTPVIVTTASSVATYTIGYQPIGTVSPPLQPNPLYPYDGLQGVASNFSVQWNDGLDATRRNSALWPTTYAIYYEYWPFGGVEPQNYTLVTAAQPCNSIYVGICQTYVTGEPNGNFRWKVIANMDVSGLTGVANSIVSTTSNVATFTVGYPSQFQGCYTDDSNRALPVTLMSSNATVESCTQAAFNAGYRYAGLQYYGWCFAGNTLGYAQDASSQCNTPCTANGNEMCGGAWHNSIWSTGR